MNEEDICQGCILPEFNPLINLTFPPFGHIPLCLEAAEEEEEDEGDGVGDESDEGNEG